MKPLLALLLLLLTGCTSPLGGLNGNFAAEQEVSVGGTRGSFSIEEAGAVNQVQRPQSSIIDSNADSIVVDESISPKFIEKETNYENPESVVVDDSVSPKFVGEETTYQNPGSVTTINETNPWFLLLLVLGWLLPSPNEIVRGLYDFIKFLRKPE